MPKIFISYRRDDSAWPAQHIYNGLCDHFGSQTIVFDVDTIPLGMDFRQYLNDEVSKCDILLAVIGPQWIEHIKKRLDTPNDYVRTEIQAALERQIPVVPVLVDRASMPIENNLPPEIVELAYRQAAKVRVGKDLDAHLKRLIIGLEKLLSEQKAVQKSKDEEHQKHNQPTREVDPITINHSLRIDDEEMPFGELEHKAFPTTYTNHIGMKFLLIPAGKFMMGSQFSSENLAKIYGGYPEFYENELPKHEVTISNALYLQSTQVTKVQWKNVMKDSPLSDNFLSRLRSKFNREGSTEDNQPVEKITWNEAQQFINKLNEIEGGIIYRLPTEAEWEYACRAGANTEFSFGDEEFRLIDHAWYRKNSGEQSHVVGEKSPNAWGLYDMHGNVWEWCSDWYGNYSSQRMKDPSGPMNGTHRVLRGGAWDCYAGNCRAAFRGRLLPVDRFKALGFRLVRLADK